MRGQHMPTTVDELKLGESQPCCSLNTPPSVPGHTLWFLPNV